MAQVNQALNDLRKQYENEHDPEKKEELKAQYLRASDEIKKVTAKAIAANNEKYTAAVAELEEANGELQKAREGLADFAEAVSKVARAVDMIGEVAAMVP